MGCIVCHSGTIEYSVVVVQLDRELDYFIPIKKTSVEGEVSRHTY